MSSTQFEVIVDRGVVVNGVLYLRGEKFFESESNSEVQYLISTQQISIVVTPGLTSSKTVSATLLPAVGLGPTGAPGPQGVAGPVALNTRYVSGLLCSKIDDTHVLVKSGKCRDSADAADMTLSTDQTVNIASVGALGSDAVAYVGGTGTNVGGTVTFTGGTGFIVQYGATSITGTISSSATAVIGVSTKFTTEVAVGDVIGSISKGYSRVSAIADDTHLTLSVAFPAGDATTVAAKILENPTLSLNGAAAAVKSISADGLTVVLVADPGQTGVTQLGVPMYDASNIGTLNVWICSGTSGTTTVVSCKRSQPLALTGYTTSVRRLWAFLIDSSLHINDARQINDYGAERWTQVGVLDGTSGYVPTNGGSSTTWARLDLRTAVPTTSNCVELSMEVTAGVANKLFVRPSGKGASGNTSTRFVSTNNSTSGGVVSCPTDGGGYGSVAVDYALSSVGTARISVCGYRERL